MNKAPNKQPLKKIVQEDVITSLVNAGVEKSLAEGIFDILVSFGCIQNFAPRRPLILDQHQRIAPPTPATKLGDIKKLFPRKLRMMECRLMKPSCKRRHAFYQYGKHAITLEREIILGVDEARI